MSIAKQIKALSSETMIYGISGTISRSIGIFLVPLYTRVFTPADYGIVALITALVGLLTTAVVLGLDNASARWFYDTNEIDQQKQVISSWFWTQFLVAVLVTVPLYLFAPSISILLLDSTEYTAVIRFAVLTIPLSTSAKVVGNWLRYQRAALMTTIFNTGMSLTTIGFTVLYVLIWQWGVPGLFWGRLLAATMMAVVAVGLLRTWIAPNFISGSLVREMLRFGLPLAPAAFASWITTSSDRFILTLFVSTSEIGLYALANTLASVIALATGGFQMAWGPFAYSIAKEEDAKAVYSQVLTLYSWLGCWLATGLTLFAPLALHLFTTPDYYAASSSVSYLVFSYIALGATYIASLGLSIVKRSGQIAISIFLGAGANILCNFLLIPYLGRDGAAVATLLSYLLAAVYLFWMSQRYYTIPYNFRNAFGAFALAWLVILINAFLPQEQTVVLTLIRLALCMLFVPLALWLQVIDVRSLQRLVSRQN